MSAIIVGGGFHSVPDKQFEARLQKGCTENLAFCSVSTLSAIERHMCGVKGCTCCGISVVKDEAGECYSLELERAPRPQAGIIMLPLLTVLACTAWGVLLGWNLHAATAPAPTSIGVVSLAPSTENH